MMPCLRWQKRYENEEDTGCTAQGAGVCGPDESQGTAQGAGHRADVADYRERCPVSGRLGVGMGFPEPGRPASAQHVAPDADGGELHCGCGFHREIADRR